MAKGFLHFVSSKIRHIFHLVSNVRPLVWICLYICAIPVFAGIYSLLPEGQFRIPDGGTTDYWSWLYYSIVSITTLGFGDYTPCHLLAQWVTAIEVMCGLVFLGFFLNAVGSMKSEIDMESEIEKQKRLREAAQRQKVEVATPNLTRLLHAFANHCNTMNNGKITQANVDELMKSAAHTSLALDALQTRVDLSFWPTLLESCFTFVANYQLLISVSGQKSTILTSDGKPTAELIDFVTQNAKLATDIQQELAEVPLTNV